MGFCPLPAQLLRGALEAALLAGLPVLAAAKSRAALCCALSSWSIVPLIMKLPLFPLQQSCPTAHLVAVHVAPGFQLSLCLSLSSTFLHRPVQEVTLVKIMYLASFF